MENNLRETFLSLPAWQTLTIDMVHQFAYCPRRMQLMYIDGQWEDNLCTDEGRIVHEKTDSREDSLPALGDDAEPVIARSVSLASETLGLTGKLDLLEIEGTEAIPVEIKRGYPPENEDRSYEPELVQLMCQSLLLREHGFHSPRGVLYYSMARKRVPVNFTAELEARTRFLINETRTFLNNTELSPPLIDSPKCNNCSLVGICLPDETNLLMEKIESNGEKTLDIRRLYPARDDALPLYVQEQGSRVGKNGDAITVSKEREVLGKFPMKDISQLVLCGNVSVSSKCIHLLCESGIPLVHLSMGHWFYGITSGITLKNSYARAAQFSVAGDEIRSLALARAFVLAKMQNQRTMLRRNTRVNLENVLLEMKRIIVMATKSLKADELMGLEGSVAALYFSAWKHMLAEEIPADFFMPNYRNRRPPKDPVNAMLSFGYALLAKEATIALLAEGLDPYWGFFHRPRHGKPALALDLMEEFRPLIVDSAVLYAINTRMLEEKDFVITPAGCAMKDAGRKTLIKAYEMRLDQMITHPVFDYRCSWRAVLRVQAKVLAKVLRGEISEYTGITTR